MTTDAEGGPSLRRPRLIDPGEQVPLESRFPSGLYEEVVTSGIEGALAELIETHDVRRSAIDNAEAAAVA